MFLIRSHSHKWPEERIEAASLTRQESLLSTGDANAVSLPHRKTHSEAQPSLIFSDIMLRVVTAVKANLDAASKNLWCLLIFSTQWLSETSAHRLGHLQVISTVIEIIATNIHGTRRCR